ILVMRDLITIRPSPTKTLIQSLVCAINRTCSKDNRGFKLSKTLLPFVVGGYGILPDGHFEVWPPCEPGTEGHFRQQHQVASVFLHVGHESLPVASEAFHAVVQFTNGDPHALLFV